MKQMTQLQKAGVFVRQNFLSAKHCADLRTKILQSRQVSGRVYHDAQSQINEDLRKTQLAILPYEDIQSIQDLFSDLKPSLATHFGLHLDRCRTPIFCCYQQGDFFKKHQDNGADDPNSPQSLAIRKITVVLFLNTQQPTTKLSHFNGGGLRLYDLNDHAKPLTVKEEEGLLIAFRSEVYHQVNAIRQGQRFSVVSWFI
ncbi:MAG: 2OG-Fe(II) oxygenase [Bacteroidota bacterium]